MAVAKFIAVHIITGVSMISDEAKTIRLISNSLAASSSYHSPLQLAIRTKQCRRRFNKYLICCKSDSIHNNNNNGRFSDKSSNGDDYTDGNHGGDDDEHDREYLQASILISETIRHRDFRINGLRQEMGWRSYGQSVPFSAPAKAGVDNALGLETLRRFKSPTIFLKISCDGEFVLPIIVGESAVEELIGASSEDDNKISWDGPNQFQFLRSLVVKLGYEVRMARITKRVMNTYFARIYFSKPGEKDILSVDARPSDAINVARRCKALDKLMKGPTHVKKFIDHVPIYVNRQLVLTDAIKYGMGRSRGTKTVYDVTLDSALEGRDLLTEELIIMRNMNSAAEEERYNDAAMWRNKLATFRNSSHGL